MSSVSKSLVVKAGVCIVLGSEEEQGPLLGSPGPSPSYSRLKFGWSDWGWLAWNLLGVGVRLPSCGGHHVGDLQGPKAAAIGPASVHMRGIQNRFG